MRNFLYKSSHLVIGKIFHRLASSRPLLYDSPISGAGAIRHHTAVLSLTCTLLSCQVPGTEHGGNVSRSHFCSWRDSSNSHMEVIVIHMQILHLIQAEHMPNLRDVEVWSRKR